MKLDIQPYRGVGDLVFGMGAAQVHALLGNDYEDLGPRYETPLTRNYYPAQGIFVDFSHPGTLVAIEMCNVADPTLQGKHMLRTPYEDLVEWLRCQDPKLVIEAGDPMSYTLGVLFYCPDYAECPLDPPESVMAFERDHWTKDYPTP